ncbi:MAG: type II toxin-antitoxin system HicB family antitoxin [Candidatus Parabeggiatoa sp. nov. 3]|nr:MAG: type II toxin-antitoxin system HicB family antitoxin [Gammaproteobacteria bacterium]RKZ67297.1 MAG: type II toxin-antitoxin system HicB family antitoxin [Gammaproteobacteria bacterium]HEW98723.1 type II toxin-antitoxin system HicB family antitoxin [Beggiatoa sp.]
MKTVTIVYWQENDGMWLGYLQNYPDYWTQGETLEELRDNLKDILFEIKNGLISQVKTLEEMVI